MLGSFGSGAKEDPGAGAAGLDTLFNLSLMELTGAVTVGFEGLLDTYGVLIERLLNISEILDLPKYPIDASAKLTSANPATSIAPLGFEFN